MENQAIIFLYLFQHSIFYAIIVYFIGMYPLFFSTVWTTMSLFYFVRKEKKDYLQETEGVDLPKVSIMIAAYNEEKYIWLALKSIQALDYPNFEVVVVNDGSTDNTLKILEEFSKEYPIRIISKKQNQGKAIAINDAMKCVEGEIILFTDADAELQSDVLQWLIPHFKSTRVAAVAGNPRIKNTDNFLCRMQALEYTTIISTIRRSQRVWGRIMTFSGVLFALRKSAFYDVGGFDINARTEDIALTWRLQRRYWDIFFENNAVAWIFTPSTYLGFIKQRIRWSQGLMYVIHQNANVLFHWKSRRMWPVLLENILSTLWVIGVFMMFLLWLLAIFANYSAGISFVPFVWGISIATVNIITQCIAIMLDKKYDPQIKRFLFYTVYFPIYYWLFLAFIAFIEIPWLFQKSRPALGWKSER
jgi:biofilm PGA synthesis N-glycosyltransferase PgaC